MTARVEQTLLRWTQAFPKGSIWQTRYISFPFALVGSALSLTHSQLTVLERGAWWTMGLLAWTLLEYILHRWVLHYQPTSVLGCAILARLHIRHHEVPADQTEVCVPFLLSLPLLATIYGTLLLFGGGTEAALLFVFGVGLMMAIYDLTHFSTHYMEPSNGLLKALKKNHMLHHYSDHAERFGVTSPFWDHVFGTQGQTARSKPAPDKDLAP